MTAAATATLLLPQPLYDCALHLYIAASRPFERVSMTPNNIPFTTPSLAPVLHMLFGLHASPH